MSRARHIRTALLVGVIGAGAIACSDPSDASTDERAVCDTMQEMTTALVAGRGADALPMLARLDDLARRSGNSAMQTAGAKLFDAIGEEVDYGAMTAEASARLGEEVLTEGAAGMDGLGDECNRLGEPIEVDPSMVTSSTER